MPKADTKSYHQVTSLGGYGNARWALDIGHNNAPYAKFGVAYFAVEYSQDANTVKEKLDGKGYVLSRLLAMHGPH